MNHTTNNQQPQCSYIVPVYNGETYLEECLDSILRQTANDFEIILINDGSTDTSAAICYDYAQKDSRIRVIHQANAGVAASRNLGIELAKGEYLCFIDSDDIIASTFFESLYNAQCEHKVDVSITKFYRFNKNGMNKTANKLNDGYYEKELLHEHCLCRVASLDKNLGSVDIFFFGFGGILYKRKKIKDLNIKFPPCIRYEDTLFLMDYLLSCENAYILHDSLYGYRTNPTSSMNALRTLDFADLKIQFQGIAQLADKHKLSVSAQLEQRIAGLKNRYLYDASIILSKYPLFPDTTISFEYAHSHAQELRLFYADSFRYLSLSKRIKVELLLLVYNVRLMYKLYFYLKRNKITHKN